MTPNDFGYDQQHVPIQYRHDDDIPCKCQICQCIPCVCGQDPSVEGDRFGDIVTPQAEVQQS